jgi:hypothetical protein
MSLNEVIEKNKNVRKILDNKVFQSTKKAIEKYNNKLQLTNL